LGLLLDDRDADAFGREIDAGAGVLFPGAGIEFSADAEEREPFEVFYTDSFAG
jgi:cystathionine beta-lyase family protein involved in aluminum resistance